LKTIGDELHMPGLQFYQARYPNLSNIQTFFILYCKSAA